jgi:hypothetical protein
MCPTLSCHLSSSPSALAIRRANKNYGLCIEWFHRKKSFAGKCKEIVKKVDGCWV